MKNQDIIELHRIAMKIVDQFDTRVDLVRDIAAKERVLRDLNSQRFARATRYFNAAHAHFEKQKAASMESPPRFIESYVLEEDADFKEEAEINFHRERLSRELSLQKVRLMNLFLERYQ